MSQSEEDAKNDFLQFLIKHNQYLTSKNQYLDNRVNIAKERNVALDAKIQTAYQESSKSAIYTEPASEITQELAQETLEDCDENIHGQLKQLGKVNEIMESRMKEEIKLFRASFQHILNRNDVAVKPYYEVIAAGQELQRKIERTTADYMVEKEKSMDAIAKIKKDCSDVAKDIENMEIVAKDLRLTTFIMQNKLNDQFTAWCMDPTTDMHSEIERVSNEILELEAKLAKLPPC